MCKAQCVKCNDALMLHSIVQCAMWVPYIYVNVMWVPFEVSTIGVAHENELHGRTSVQLRRRHGIQVSYYVSAMWLWCECHVIVIWVLWEFDIKSVAWQKQVQQAVCSWGGAMGLDTSAMWLWCEYNGSWKICWSRRRCSTALQQAVCSSGGAGQQIVSNIKPHPPPHCNSLDVLAFL